MNTARFSPLELAFLDEDNWFKTFRIVEKNPALLTEELSARLLHEAELCEDPEEAFLLRESSKLIARAISGGIQEAAEEKLGKGGVFAGTARETRDRYYEERDPRFLLESLDQFVEGLRCDDDPLAFDQGRTLQGFGATLLDLSEILPDPAVNYVGCLAFLASLTAHLSVMTLHRDEVWVDRLEKNIWGIRRHLDRADALPLGASEYQFYESLRRACELTDESLEQGVEGVLGRVFASFPLLSMALAVARMAKPLPHAWRGADDDFQEVAESWLELIREWIDRYGSDCLRALIVSPMSTWLPDESFGDPDLSSGRRFELPIPGELLKDLDPDGQPPQGPFTPGREVLSLLALAVFLSSIDPAEARSVAEAATEILGRVDSWSGTEAASAFHDRETLIPLTAAVRAALQASGDPVERFRGVRAALGPQMLAEWAGAVEADLAMSSGDPTSSPPLLLEAATQMALCLRELANLLGGVSTELGLPDARRYEALRDRLDELLLGDKLDVRLIRVDGTVPLDQERSELLARFEADLSNLDEREGEDLRSWLSGAYETGELSFANAGAETAFLVNLSWLHLRLGDPNTLKWAHRARQLAFEQGNLIYTATADVNASSHYLNILPALPPWTVDTEDAMGRLLSIVGGLSHAVESLQITIDGFEPSNPEDRFHVSLGGYPMVRRLIEGILFEARDGSLLTEYLLNARGMWFLLGAYDSAEGEALRPIVTWRGRCWVDGPRLKDVPPPPDRVEATSKAELADILSPRGVPEALWFGNVLSADRRTIASSMIAPPTAFAAIFEPYPESFDEPERMSCTEIATALGRTVPDRIWRVADLIAEHGERLTLFVSLDPDLPSLSMGMWRRPGGGGVLADAFDIVYCPSLLSPEGSVPWVDRYRTAGPQTFVVCDPLGDLPGARVVPSSSARVCGNSLDDVDPPADRETVLTMIDECARADGIFLYQGHSSSGALDRPDAACLILEPSGPSAAVGEPLPLPEMLKAVRASSSRRMPRRMAFLSCASGSVGSSYDATGLAMGALAGGSDAVISTLRPVPDGGRWRRVVDEMVEVLGAAQPWQAFGDWQRQMARTLDADGSDDDLWVVSGLAMFGGPFGPAVGTVGEHG